MPFTRVADLSVSILHPTKLLTRHSYRRLAMSSCQIMAPVSPRDPRPCPRISRDEVEALIADGRKIVIFQRHVLKVDQWLPYHPGGDKAILHMVGRDATAEIEA